MKRYTAIYEDVSSDIEQRKEAVEIYETLQAYISKNLKNIQITADNPFNDYHIKRNKVGGYTFVYEEIDDLHPNLIFQFNPIDEAFKGGLGRYGKYIIIVLNVLIGQYDLKYIDTRLIGNKATIIHELIHYLDELRFGTTYRGDTIKKYKTGGIEAYINTPEEFNAHYQELTSRIENVLTLIEKSKEYILSSYKSFRFYLISSAENADIIKKLNVKYKKKLDKRLYQFYIYLVDKFKYEKI